MGNPSWLRTRACALYPLGTPLCPYSLYGRILPNVQTSSGPCSKPIPAVGTCSDACGPHCKVFLRQKITPVHELRFSCLGPPVLLGGLGFRAYRFGIMDSLPSLSVSLPLSWCSARSHGSPRAYEDPTRSGSTRHLGSQLACRFPVLS